jgi:hypothetical protein
MCSIHRIIRELIVTGLVSLSVVSSAQASLIQLFSPTDLSPGGVTYDYLARPTGQQPVLPSPFDLVGPDNTLTFTEAGTAFVRMDQEPSIPAVGGWGGTFAPATRLLYTGNNVDSNWFGPITISFALPILEFGLLAQFNNEMFLGPFSFNIFNGSVALGTLTNGVTNLPSFLGARATDGELITSILIGGPSTAASDNDFAIGPVTAQGVPEPGALTLTLIGIGGLRFFAHRTRAKKLDRRR